MINALQIPDVPTTTNGIPIRNLWYMLSYAWKDRRLLDRWRSDIESAPSLDGLLARMLLNSFTQRSRIGLGRDYRPHEETLSGIRGRVDFATSLKKLTFQNAKAHCRFHIFDPNVRKNQIINSSLDWVGRNGDFGSSPDVLRREIWKQVHQLVNIDTIELTPSLVRRELLLKHDYDYHFMLTLCHLILNQQIPMQDEGIEQSQVVDPDWKFVWRLFESFVANFYRYHLKQWKVSPQKRMRWPALTDELNFLPLMKPDLVLQHKETKRRVILDTKLTANCLNETQSGKLKVSSGHLYQLYAYLRSQEESWGEMTGMLLYPAVKYRLSKTVEMHGHRLRWETIDLSQEWKAIEDDLLALSNSFL